MSQLSVVGTGVIGNGWISRALANGWDVVAFDPAPDAEVRTRAFVANAWHALEKDGLAFTGRLAAPALVSERFMGSFDRGVGIVVRCNAIATDHLPSRGIDAIGFLPVGTQAPFAANQEFRRLIEEASRRIGNLVHTRISFP